MPDIFWRVEVKNQRGVAYLTLCTFLQGVVSPTRTVILLGQRTKYHVVNSHRPISSMVKRSRAICSAAKQSSSKSDSQNFLTLVLAVNTVCMGVTTLDLV